MDNEKKKDFKIDTILPKEVRYDPTLTYFEKIFYADIVIRAYESPTGECRIHNDEFMQSFGISLSYVHLALRSLKEKGLILVKRGGGRHRIIIPRIFD